MELLRSAVRSLRRAPTFTAAAVATLALGIGAVSIVLSLLQAVLLAPLPYPAPDRLVRVFEAGEGQPRFPMSPAYFLDYRRRSRSLASLAVYTRQDLQIAGDGPPSRVATLLVSPEYFGILGFAPALGRVFEERETFESAHVVVLSHGFWTRRFAADPAIVGRVLRLDGEPWTVVGVMPPGLQHVGGDYRSLPHGETVDAWAPVPLGDAARRHRWHYLNALGRLADGATAAQAAGELDGIAAAAARRFGEAEQPFHPRVVPLAETIVGGERAAILLLAGAVGLVLLVACANVAGLLLARGLSRRREMAVRFALGAGRGRLARYLLAESAVLAALGCGGGLALAAGGLPLLRAVMPPDFPRLHAVRMDLGVLALTVGISMLTVLVFGLLPAWRGARGDVQPALRGEGRSATAGPGALRARSALVVGELTLAAALLVGAGLLVRSFERLLATDPGFHPEHVLTFSLALPPRYDHARATRFFAQLEDGLQALPGVRAAGLGTALPWTGWDENSGFRVVGADARSSEPSARSGAASPGLFRALGVPLRAGRLPAPEDSLDAPPVVVVNEALARTYLGGADPVGREIELWGRHVRVAGVVGDVKDTPVALAAVPAFFWPVAQSPFKAVVVAVRTDGAPLALVPAVRAAVQGLDPEVPIADVRDLASVAADAFARRRFLLACVTGLAGLALLLAAIGAYGALAYAVEQRRRELCVRVALGADRAHVLGLILGQGLRLGAAGVCAGAAIALGSGRLLESHLYGITPRDPVTFAAATLLVLAVAALASLTPALRATRADPASVLRSE